MNFRIIVARDIRPALRRNRFERACINCVPIRDRPTTNPNRGFEQLHGWVLLPRVRILAQAVSAEYYGGRSV